MGINFLHEVHEGKLKNRGFFEHSEPTTENVTVYAQERPLPYIFQYFVWRNQNPDCVTWFAYQACFRKWQVLTRTKINNVRTNDWKTEKCVCCCRNLNLLSFGQRSEGVFLLLLLCFFPKVSAIIEVFCFKRESQLPLSFQLQPAKHFLSQRSFFIHQTATLHWRHFYLQHKKIKQNNSLLLCTTYR